MQYLRKVSIIIICLMALFIGAAKYHPAFIDPSVAAKTVKSDDEEIPEEIIKELLNQKNKPEPKHEKPSLKPGELYVPVIEFGDEVDDDTVADAIRKIAWANEDGAYGIVLNIDSPGGSVSAGMKLMRAIEESDAPVVCIVDTAAYSMGFYILQSCDVRSTTTRGRLMIHRAFYSGLFFGGRAGEAEIMNLYNNLHTLNEQFIENTVRRSLVTRKELEEKIQDSREWWVVSKEALEKGFVDRIDKNAKDIARALHDTGDLP